MKPKGLLIAVVLLAVLGGLTWWSNKTRRPTKARRPPTATTKLLTIPDDQFQEIKIKKVTGELLDLKTRKRQVADDRAQADGRRPGCGRFHGLHPRQSQRG